jgi:hypothetical protein
MGAAFRETKITLPTPKKLRFSGNPGFGASESHRPKSPIWAGFSHENF